MGDALAEIMGRINKKYGNGTIMYGGQKSEVVPRLQTGAFTADYAMGGGIPMGRVSILWGSESSGKSTMAQKLIASAQKMCFSCYAPLEECQCKSRRECVVNYQDVEGTWDEEWAKLLGVNSERVVFAKPEYSEEVIDVVDALLRSGEIDFVVIDSLAMMIPSQDIERGAEQWTMGQSARVNNKGFNKWRASMDDCRKKTGRKPTVLVLNQVRSKIGVVYGSPDVMPGGLGQLYSASMIIRLRQGKYEFTETEPKTPLTAEIHGRVDKSKVGPPRQEFAFRLALQDHIYKDIPVKKGDIVEFDEVRKIAEAVGLFGKNDKGKWVYGKHEYQRQAELYTDWIYNMKGLRKVKRDLLRALVK